MPFDLLRPHVRDLGAFTVRRLLPAALHRHVGPFVFFDHMGPVDLAAGHGMDVRPHPHIGLATVTYLFEGRGLHRDSLGTVQEIAPGDINWMVAGGGIVHSERTPPDELERPHRLHGLQIWVGLPLAHESAAPSFSHHPAASLPERHLPGVALRILAGTAFGARAPTPTLSPAFYVDATLLPGAELVLPNEYPERAVYAVDQGLEVDGMEVPPQSMAVLSAGSPVRIRGARAESGARVMLLGGEPLDGGERHINWNFVASSRAAIEAARASWAAYPSPQFPAVPGESEWIPLPEH